jgi:SAM-dependent methyltransferase
LGTDLSAAAAAKAREYGVEVRRGTLAEQNLASQSFDVGILCHSLEHLSDPNDELAELARVLKPGGHLHIAVPNGQAVRLALDGTDWMHLSHPLHLWFFDARTLALLLERHGFRVAAPARTTTRHHAFGDWRHDLRRVGWARASQRLWRFLRATASTPDGGDVLRIVARRA